MGDSSTLENAATSLPQRLALRLVRLPRLARISITALFAVVAALLITPLIDSIYTTRFFDYNTLMLPSLVSTGVGIVMYVIGWIVLVGYSGEELKPRKRVLLYVVVGCLMVLTALVLVITGALDGSRT